MTEITRYTSINEVRYEFDTGEIMTVGDLANFLEKILASVNTIEDSEATIEDLTFDQDGMSYSLPDYEIEEKL